MEWPDNLGNYPAYWHSRIKRGFGLGVGATYHPWLRVRDVPSHGSSGNPKGITVPRVYHLLSRLERTYFHLVDRQMDVVDIREQFPILHLHGTQKLCAELGVVHPRKGGFPEPFTIDFVVSRKTPSGLVHEAKSIKTPADAVDPAVRLRLKVEHRWCQQAGIDWKLILTDGFTDDLATTLTFMRGWHRHRYTPEKERADQFAKTFESVYKPNVPLKDLLEECSARAMRGYSQCSNDFRYCSWSNRINVDLASRLSLDLPVVLHGSKG